MKLLIFLVKFSGRGNLVEIYPAMLPVDGLGGKYAVGKMAEIITACNHKIFELREDIRDASRNVMDMEKIPAVCTSSSTCFREHSKTIREKPPINRATRLPIPPEIKNIGEVRLKQLYQKLVDLEDLGRSEWLNVFLYVSSYVKVLRLLARGDWDKPKKFVQRQTLTLDGPYPGVPNNLIIADNEPPRSKKIVKKSLADLVPKCPLITGENVEFRHQGSRKLASLDPRVLCDCLEVVPRSPSGSKTRKKQSIDKIRPRYLKKYDYCTV